VLIARKRKENLDTRFCSRALYRRANWNFAGDAAQ
jgi:hypothetical protein